MTGCSCDPWLLLLVLISLLSFIMGLDNGLALTPPMGWMPYERFRCLTNCKKFPRDCISESLFKRTADLLISEGYAAVGYKYVIMDDCWMAKKRNAKTNRLVADKQRFPSGLNNLSDYIHQKGLKFGIYHDIGRFTCEHRGPGAHGHFKLDAQTFANWKVDYVKVDGCYVKGIDLNVAYPAFGYALNQTGRKMVYSCSWPYYVKEPNFEVIKQHCNLWRFADDIRDSADAIGHTLLQYFNKQDELQKHGGRGHWNDLDMLVLGNYYLSYDASRFQLAIWTVLAAPLIMTNDLETVRPEIKALLQNRDIIGVNQDELGLPGRCIYDTGAVQTWLRRIMPTNNVGLNSFAIAFAYNGEYKPCPLCPMQYKVFLESMELNNTAGYMVYDLFNISNNLGLYKPDDEFMTKINPQGVTFYKFKAVDFY